MPSLGSTALNVCMIVAGLLFMKHGETAVAKALAWAVLAGAVIRLVIMIPPLLRRGFRYHWRLNPASPAMRRLFLMMAPALFGLAVANLNVGVSRIFATILGKGYVLCLVNSNRLIQLPLAIVATTLGTAILPQLSQYHAENRPQELRRLAMFAFRVLFILFIPAMVGLAVLGEPIVRILFERGRWTAQGTAWTWFALMFYVPGLPFWGMLRVLTPLYYARHDVKTPVYSATGSMLVGVAFNVCLVNVPFLREHLGHGGLALSSTLGGIVQATMLWWILRRRGIALWDARMGSTLLRCGGAAAGMGAAAWAQWHYVAAPLATGALASAVLLVAVVAVSGGVYFALAFFFRVPDLRQALALVARRRIR
jgi:putative peptidoglycan lipid II flippase